MASQPQTSAFSVGQKLCGSITKVTPSRLYVLAQGGAQVVIPQHELPGGCIDKDQYREGQQLEFHVKHIAGTVQGTVIPDAELISKADVYVGQILDAVVVKHLEFGVVASLKSVLPFTTVLLPQSQCSKAVGAKSALQLLKTLLPLFSQVTLAITHVLPDGKLKGTVLAETFRLMGLDEGRIRIKRPTDGNRVEMRPVADKPAEPSIEKPVILAQKLDTSQFAAEMTPFEMELFDDEIDFSAAASSAQARVAPSKALKSGPQSEREFELLIAQQPQASFLYLQYVAFHLERANLDAALRVINRGLAQIPQSSPEQLQEHLNLLVARLQIELQFYGESIFLESVASAFSSQADPGRLCEQLVAALETSPELQGQVFDIFFNAKQRRADFACHKLKLEYLYRTGQEERARKSVQDVIQQVKLADGQATRQFLSFLARLEYQFHHVAEGRAAYEKLIETSKLDIILHYLDCEEKYGDLAYLRSLYKRLVEKDYGARRNKVMSALLKKWLEIEKKQGDQQRIAEIRALAAQMLE